jgi:hypothetical protein
VVCITVAVLVGWRLLGDSWAGAACFVDERSQSSTVLSALEMLGERPAWV